MPPVKVEMVRNEVETTLPPTKMALVAAAIVPALLISPPKVDIVTVEILAKIPPLAPPPTTMPPSCVVPTVSMRPVLVMPPVKVEIADASG